MLCSLHSAAARAEIADTGEEGTNAADGHRDTQRQLGYLCSPGILPPECAARVQYGA